MRDNHPVIQELKNRIAALEGRTESQGRKIKALEAKVEALENRWAGQNPRIATPEEYAVIQTMNAPNMINVCQKEEPAPTQPAPTPKAGECVVAAVRPLTQEEWESFGNVSSVHPPKT